MRARLVRIGNSRGIRLPKPVIKTDTILTEDVEVQVRDNAVVIKAAVRPRYGWAEAARLARRRGDDRLLDEPTAMHFDSKEWQWK